MSLSHDLRVALVALPELMRTALTVLGMIIGVAAVIAMFAIGAGAQPSIEPQIQSAGTNLIVVTAGNFLRVASAGQGQREHVDARRRGRDPYESGGPVPLPRLNIRGQSWPAIKIGTHRLRAPAWRCR